MAYISQEMKKELAPKIKEVLKKYGVKATISIRNHMTLSVNIQSGSIDFSRAKSEAARRQVNGAAGFTATDGKFYDQVNTYHISSFYEGTAKDFLKELHNAMKQPTSRGEWYDKTDIMTDYFDVAYYTDINVGRWDKGYVQTA